MVDGHCFFIYTVYEKPYLNIMALKKVCQRNLKPKLRTLDLHPQKVNQNSLLNINLLFISFPTC